MPEYVVYDAPLFMELGWHIFIILLLFFFNVNIYYILFKLMKHLKEINKFWKPKITLMRCKASEYSKQDDDPKFD